MIYFDGTKMKRLALAVASNHVLKQIQLVSNKNEPRLLGLIFSIVLICN
jgi:hypothetical protein